MTSKIIAGIVVVFALATLGYSVVTKNSSSVEQSDTQQMITDSQANGVPVGAADQQVPQPMAQSNSSGTETEDEREGDDDSKPSSAATVPTNTAPAPTGSTNAPAAAKTYTLADVASHKTPSNCWTAVNGKVYDLTAWIARHPGGEMPIEGMCGVDATSKFAAQHGGQVKPENVLGGFYIGNLK